ncbi:hypothetical protein [Halothece sp. PCC 7418]|uniref:hypothetical protein n=1 Tax=Halothece sp. (strain PCC 7418) TaxID=65093 RepID=UPI0012372AB7|nr:hypothetical protein [Halothece sp. PCC 7418]
MTIIFDPHYPKKVLAFSYYDFTIEICIDEDEDGITYSAWIGYDYGWAMATPAANTKNQAIREAKKWVDLKRKTHG